MNTPTRTPPEVVALEEAEVGRLLAKHLPKTIEHREPHHKDGNWAARHLKLT